MLVRRKRLIYYRHILPFVLTVLIYSTCHSWPAFFSYSRGETRINVYAGEADNRRWKSCAGVLSEHEILVPSVEAISSRLRLVSTIISTLASLVIKSMREQGARERERKSDREVERESETRELDEKFSS